MLRDTCKWLRRKVRLIKVSCSGGSYTILGLEDSLSCEIWTYCIQAKQTPCKLLIELALGAKCKCRFNLHQAKLKNLSPGSALLLHWGVPLTQFDESNHGFVMDLASDVWVIDRAIEMEMVIGKARSPTRTFLLFSSWGRRKRKIGHWLSNSLTLCQIVQPP